MKNEIFYIIIKNRFYHHDSNNYHIERIFTKEQSLIVIDEIIEQMENDGFVDKYNPFIITNDKELLMKYIFVLNLSEFKMLCGSKNFKKEDIRINSNYFRKFNIETFYYFVMIKNNEIISANEYWSGTTIEDTYLGNGKFAVSINTGRGVLIEEYCGWQINKNFYYFKTPTHYPKNGNDIFRLKNIQSTSLENLNLLIGESILKLSLIGGFEVRKGCLHYMNKEIQKKLILTKTILEKIIENPDLKIGINTSLDKNHIITYFVTGLFNKEGSYLDISINYDNRDCDYPKLYDRNSNKLFFE